MEKARFDKKQRELASVFGEIDKDLLVILKGHLLLEESLNYIIENFVFHTEHVTQSRISFYQKLCLARSMSLSEQDSAVWTIIEKINSLRNDFAHKLESAKREIKVQEIRKLYEMQMKGSEFEHDWDNAEIATFLAFAISFCLGFLTSFEAEVDRFKGYVKIINKTINEV